MKTNLVNCKQQPENVNKNSKQQPENVNKNCRL